MKRSTTLVSLLLVLAGAAAAAAGTFTVTLTNGSIFETRYRPTTADWDENLVLLFTDRGNQIALLRSEIADITSSVEESGFGYQVNTSTLFLGWSPQDILEEGEVGEGEGGGNAQLQQAFPEEQPVFSVEQFVNPPTEPGIGVPADTGF